MPSATWTRRLLRRSGGRRIRHRIPDRPPIVLLHGIELRSHHVALGPGRVARDRSRSPRLAFDLPGHGNSPDASSYSFEAVLNAVRSAIVAAGLDAPVMVGHSGAAGTAAMYAARYPTSGVVAVDGSFMVGELRSRCVQSVRGALEGPGFDCRVGTDHGRRLRPRRRRARGPRVQSRRRAGRARRSCAATAAELLEGDPDELQRHGGPRGPMRSARLGVPAVVRDRSRAFGPARRRGWRRTFRPRARHEAWPRQQGHFPHLAHPRRFAALLRETAATEAAGSAPCRFVASAFAGRDGRGPTRSSIPAIRRRPRPDVMDARPSAWARRSPSDSAFVSSTSCVAGSGRSRPIEAAKQLDVAGDDVAAPQVELEQVGLRHGVGGDVGAALVEEPRPARPGQHPRRPASAVELRLDPLLDDARARVVLRRSRPPKSSRPARPPRAGAAPP